MILLIDNYDSFVYNLARYFAELGCETRVVRNDRLSVEDAIALRPQAMVLSPGPCTPNEAGISLELIRRLPESIPLLGVCLGHQAIAAALGGRVVRAGEPVHGRTSLVRHDGTNLFRGVANPLRATRYHSLVVDEATLPAELAITARTTDGVPMALQHRGRPMYGVQFHPESVLTDGGHRMLRNFLELSGLPAREAPPGDLADRRPPRPEDAAAQFAAPPVPWW